MGLIIYACGLAIIGGTFAAAGTSPLFLIGAYIGGFVCYLSGLIKGSEK